MKHIVITHTISQGYITAYRNEDGTPVIFPDESTATAEITDAMQAYNQARLNEGEHEDLMCEPEDWAVSVDEAKKEYGIKL
mgnify:CR=1 FL=1|jgi:hypothetical protein